MKRRRTFTTEFKREAVRLIRDGVSYGQVSRDLNVFPTQLRAWVKAVANNPENAFPGQGRRKPEQSEFARLKLEVSKLKDERDVLEKAVAYFSRTTADMRVIGYTDCSEGIPSSRPPFRRASAEEMREHFKSAQSFGFSIVVKNDDPIARAISVPPDPNRLYTSLEAANPYSSLKPGEIGLVVRRFTRVGTGDQWQEVISR